MNVDEGPARKAGVKRFDVVTEFNGRKIKNSRDLSDSVADVEPGQTVKMKVLRNQKTVNLDITLAERPAESSIVARRQMETPEESTQNLPPARPQLGIAAPFSIGFNIADLTPEIRNSFNLDKEIKHPIIVVVNRNSLASRIGLRVGDLIISVNSAEPKSAQDVIKSLKKGEKNSMIVARGRGISSMSFDIPK